MLKRCGLIFRELYDSNGTAEDYALAKHKWMDIFFGNVFGRFRENENARNNPRDVYEKLFTLENPNGVPLSYLFHNNYVVITECMNDKCSLYGEGRHIISINVKPFLWLGSNSHMTNEVISIQNIVNNKCREGLIISSRVCSCCNEKTNNKDEFLIVPQLFCISRFQMK